MTMADIQYNWGSVPKMSPVYLNQPSSAFALVLVSLAITSCSSNFTVTPLVDAGINLPASNSIEVVHEKPDREFLAIASFHGVDRKKCDMGNELCDLREKARKMGAHAIWVQKTNTTDYAGDWIHYNDRMIRVYPYSITTKTGVFIVYR